MPIEEDASTRIQTEALPLSTIGISSSLLSQIAGSSSTANQFATDLNQVAQDLQSGNLSAAQEDFVTLSNDALNGATSSTATTSASGITTNLLSDIASSADSSTSFADGLSQLGSDLQNGDLSAAQGDMLNLDTTALNAASAAATSSNPSSAATSASTQVSAMDSEALIQAIVQAMGAGDTTAIGDGLTELASISPSSQGASILSQMAANYGSSTSATSDSGSTQQLLQSMNANSTSDSASILSMIA
ncbi:MAG TPA: hypothetical protein VMD29_03410 [Terracidiphilus sp.]|nr:hypothetical protein [Terracidiphilus sp.]